MSCLSRKSRHRSKQRRVRRAAQGAEIAGQAVAPNQLPFLMTHRERIRNLPRLNVENPSKYQEVQAILSNRDFYRLYSSGTHVFIDPANCEVICVIKFTSFPDMDLETRAGVNHLSKLLIERYNNGASISSSFNGPMIDGFMGGLGWRKSSGQNQIIGMYAPKKKFNSQQELDNYLEVEAEAFRKLEQFLHKRFEGMAKVAAKHARDQIQNLGVPSFGQPEVHEDTFYHFASNLTFTLKNFHNHSHKDRDSNTWTFGMWIPIKLPDGRVVCFRDGYDVQGGQFVFDMYGFGADFNKCDGIGEIVWQSNMYDHQTV